MPKIRRRIIGQMIVAGMMFIIANNAFAYHPTLATFNSSSSMRMQGTDGDFSPNWSPDGEWITFGSDRAGNWDIWIVNADGSQMINLTADSTENEFLPKWSPDGKRIAFVSTSGCIGNGCTDLWVMNSDGTNAANFTETIDGSVGSAGGGDYQWSPSSDTLFVPYYHNKKTQLWLIKLDGTHELGDIPTRNISLPSLSGTGSQMAFVADNTLWIAESDGSELHQIEMLNEDIENVAWSPIDDNLLAVVTKIDENFIVEKGLILIDLNTGEIIELLNKYRLITEISWSPDGNTIAFVGGVEESDTANINLVRIVQPNAINLTTESDSYNLQPAWSPDSSKIAFISTTYGPFNIWIMNSDGSEPYNLTEQVSAAQ